MAKGEAAEINSSRLVNKCFKEILFKKKSSIQIVIKAQRKGHLILLNIKW